MRSIIFFATSSFSVASFAKLIQLNLPIKAVVTQPDKKRGRGQKLAPSIIKEAATKEGIAVWQPDDLSDPLFLAKLSEAKPDVGIVIDYGKMIPQTMLAMPKHGMINVHPSLLPKWRGASPIVSALLHQDTLSGVSVIRINERLDAGNILAQQSLPIDEKDNGQTLHDKLSTLGSHMLGDVLLAIQAEKALDERIQDEKSASYAQKIRKEDYYLDFGQSAHSLHKKIAAFYPDFIARAVLDGETIRLLASEAIDADEQHPKGTIYGQNDRGLLVQTGKGSLVLRMLQKPGKKPIEAKDFYNAYQPIGKRFAPWTKDA